MSNGLFVASFAIWSTYSFHCIPTCAEHHIIEIFGLLERIFLIVNVVGHVLFLFRIDCIDDSESVTINVLSYVSCVIIIV